MLDMDPRKRLTARQVLGREEGVERAAGGRGAGEAEAVLSHEPLQEEGNAGDRRATVGEGGVGDQGDVRVHGHGQQRPVHAGGVQGRPRQVGSKLLMEAADVDGDGYLDYAEFIAITIHLHRLSNDQHLRKAFLFFDRDSSGYIKRASTPGSAPSHSATA
ncbi:hypothetical protein ZWY2020_028648 [Hordeum vulgare]|nr:hypothetical protein ZWY2020_028648 [Hordeum vulgare]